MSNALLIVNADDFGLTEGTTVAIIDAHRHGIVTSTSLLANAYSFDHAADQARRYPSLGVGVHFTLTEGPPVAPDVQELLRPDGKFPLSNQPFVRALAAGRLPVAAIRREFEAQVRKVLNAGIHPTHVDGHKYIHLLPGISVIAADVARQFAIPVMRIPHRFVDSLSRSDRVPGLLALGLMGTLAYRAARRSRLQTADRFAGFVDTGHLTREAIRRLLGGPYAGRTELLCHPAYRSPELEALLSQGYRWIAGYDFNGETAAVSDPDLRRELESKGWTFGTFADLPRL